MHIHDATLCECLVHKGRACASDLYRSPYLCHQDSQASNMHAGLRGPKQLWSISPGDTGCLSCVSQTHKPKLLPS